MKRLRLVIQAALVCAFLASAAVGAFAATGSLDRAEAELQSLASDPKRAAFRHNWQNLEARLLAELKADPARAAKTRLLLGRVAEGMGGVSGLSADHRKAVEHYAAVASGRGAGGDGAVVDEALLRKARLECTKLGEAVQAKADLDRLLAGNPTGETGAKARELYKMLTGLDYIPSAVAAASKKPAAPNEDAGRKSTVKGVPSPAVKTAALDAPSPKPSAKSSSELAEQLGLTIKTIMIDPGHGGKDPGAEAFGIAEKDVNLAFALALGRRLREKGFTILYTREKDVFIPLEERTALANAKKADLFLSVHCNAYKTGEASGVETYYLDGPSSEDAVRVAARENAVSAKKLGDLDVILTDFMLDSKMKESKELAKTVQGKVLQATGKRSALADGGAKSAPFYVLMGAKMPAILLEIGYITNPDEAKNMKSRDHLDRMAQGVVEGVLGYRGKIERMAGK